MNKFKVSKKIFNMIVIVSVMILSSVVTVFAERIITSGVVSYNNKLTGLDSTDVQGALDELYNKCVPEHVNFASYLMSLSDSDTVIADDGTNDHNMRYMGNSPKNYVTFNGEEWRVIGVFNNIDDGSGKTETRVKIIKSTSIGVKQWHTENINIWKSSSLSAELQSLSYASNIIVEEAVWYLGDPGGNHTQTASQAYTTERGTKVSSGNDRTWIGKVGLMYPSDYGFASSACKDGTKTLYDYNVAEANCFKTDWLYLGSTEWTLSPRSDSTQHSRPVNDGRISMSYPENSRHVRPVVYLRTDVVCKNCSNSSAGSQSRPFVIG